MRNRFCSFVWAVALVCFLAFAQSTTTNSSFSGTDNNFHGTMHFSPRPLAGKPVTGAPYSAQRVREHVQIAADGTRFTTTTQQETVYRDSQGRTRTERPVLTAPNVPDAPMLVEISDPVANVGYTLDTQNKVAHRVAYSSSSARPTGASGKGSGGGGGWVDIPSTGKVVVSSATQTATAVSGASVSASLSTSVSSTTSGPGRARPEFTRESLGSKLIESVLADGQRMTQTWAVGTQGNDRPFQTTFETWYSPELEVTVLDKNFDPRSGENSTKLINISRAEPPVSLFQPPPDYTIVDEPGPFEIRWTGTGSR